MPGANGNGHESNSIRKLKQGLSNLGDKERLNTTKQLGNTMTSIGEARNTINSALSKNTKKKKEKLRVYDEIDRDYFKKTKPSNPLEFIDTDKLKVMINPGVPYISTSQNEIFERRIKENEKELYNKINQFIAAPKNDIEVGIYEGAEEEAYIESAYLAYQLKTQYKHKQVEEIAWDSDDEDALILAQQPYETVM